jgi:hypothetical protein
MFISSNIAQLPLKIIILRYIRTLVFTLDNFLVWDMLSCCFFQLEKIFKKILDLVFSWFVYEVK